LQLQDQYGIDIPLLLFCCWSGGRYGELSSALLEQAVSFSKGWSANSTRPLRAIRRDMKTSFSAQWPVSELDWSALREQVKALELKSEELMLNGLDTLLSDMPVKSGGVAASIKNIKHCFQLSVNTPLIELLLPLLVAVFEESTESVQLLLNSE